MITRSQRLAAPLFDVGQSTTSPIITIRNYNELMKHEQESLLALASHVTRYFSASEGDSQIWKAAEAACNEEAHKTSDSKSCQTLQSEKTPRNRRRTRSAAAERTPIINPRNGFILKRIQGYETPVSHAISMEKTKIRMLEENKVTRRPKKRVKSTSGAHAQEAELMHCECCGVPLKSQAESASHICNIAVVRCPHYPSCMFHTSDGLGLRSHVATFHRKSPYFKCEKCDKSFETASKIYNHMKDSSAEHPDFKEEWKDWVIAHSEYDYRDLRLD